MAPDAALPPFSGENPKCPKCGHKGASVEFLPYGDCMHGPGPNMWSGWNENERLHRACNSCGYKWDEATVPLDQEAR